MIKTLLKNKLNIAYVIFILALMVADPAITSWMNFWLQRIYNLTTVGAEVASILRMLTIGFLVWLLKRFIVFISASVRAGFICGLKRRLKQTMFDNIFALNTANIVSEGGSGEYISAFTNDINILEQRYFDNIIDLIANIIAVIVLGASFFTLNVKLAAFILIFGLISMCVPLIFSRKLNEKNLYYSERLAFFTQKLKEYVAAYPTIKNYSVEEQFEESFRKINDETEDARLNSELSLALADNTGHLISWFMQLIAIGLGVILIVRGEVLIGTVIAAQSFAGDLGTPMQKIVSNVDSIRSVRSIKEKIRKLSTPRNPDEEVKPQNTKSEELANARIVFDDLTVRVGEREIISHFSYTFEPGKKYLVVGRNGSGKSSIFKVLKKRLENYTGNILINGRRLSDMNNAEISSVISYLNENVALLSGIVKDNITLFRSYRDESLQSAMEQAQIKLAPDRTIDDAGLTISSGEQRRIEIARSLLETVDVLVFDEVISTLDIETAYEIEKMVLGYKDKTIIFVSHNFSGKLIREYDSILVMEDGKLVGDGNYEQLIQNNEYFRRICEIKFGKID